MREEDNARRAGRTAPTLENAKSGNSSKLIVTQKIKRNTKLHRVLSALLERSYNLFEAADDLHDRSLHSTVSTIQNQYLIRVDRCTETVPGFGGAPTQVSRYWISSDQHELAYSALGVFSSGEVV